MTILLVGACGSGKTWVMNQLIAHYKANTKAKLKTIDFRLSKENIAILGKYDGSTFEGSDKLSMSVMKDVNDLKTIKQKHQMTIICEGDRFTNKTFIEALNPTIIKINDNGSLGRKLRGSTQSERQIKSIETRVSRITEHLLVENSTEALQAIIQLITKNNTRK